ncbi:TPA: hypothetical protein RZJ87_001704 [Campylobacter jejuni]|nr:hypothetical protein [Campylobacter jejuni]
MSQINNNTEIKEQDTQDEIVFERKKTYWIFAFLDNKYCILCFALYLFPRLFNKEIDYKWFIVFLHFFLGYIYL